MANWQGMQLTKQGRALMAKLMAHANGNLPTVLTRIALGGGVLPTGQNLENMTGLLNEHTSLPVSGYSIIGNEVVQVETSFKSGDFPQAVKLHEIGVFATDPDDGEILYAYDNAAEGDTIPANSGGTQVIRTFRILLQVANAANVSITIIDSGSTEIWEAIEKARESIDAVAADLAAVTMEQAGGITANTAAVTEIESQIATLTSTANAVIEDAGLTPSDSDNIQLAQAIDLLIATALGTIDIKSDLIYPGAFHDFYEQAPLSGWMVRDGALIANASTAVPKLYEALQLSANAWKLKTETEWQALSAVAGGVGGVPFFVLDTGANTIRLPDTRGDYARNAGSGYLQSVGDWHGDAIRNITGSSGAIMLTQYNGALGSGALYQESGGTNRGANANANTAASIGLNVSRVVPTADENRTRAFAMLGCVYVGV